MTDTASDVASDIETMRYSIWGGNNYGHAAWPQETFRTLLEAVVEYCRRFDDVRHPLWGEVNSDEYVIVSGTEAESFDGWTRKQVEAMFDAWTEWTDSSNHFNWRMICSEWHSGQWSPFYAFMSYGLLVDAHKFWAECQEDIADSYADDADKVNLTEMSDVVKRLEPLFDEIGSAEFNAQAIKIFKG